LDEARGDTLTIGFTISDVAHGSESGSPVEQMHIRTLKDGGGLRFEPRRAQGFPIVSDLTVDRSPFDRIVGAGGFISAHTRAASSTASLAYAAHPRRTFSRCHASASRLGRSAPIRCLLMAVAVESRARTRGAGQDDRRDGTAADEAP